MTTWSIPSSLTSSKKSPDWISWDWLLEETETWEFAGVEEQSEIKQKQRLPPFSFLALHFLSLSFPLYLHLDKGGLFYLSGPVHLCFMNVTLPDMNLPGLPFLLTARWVPAGRAEDLSAWHLPGKSHRANPGAHLTHNGIHLAYSSTRHCLAHVNSAFLMC